MLNRALNHLEELLVTFLMGAATLIIFISVAHRYLAMAKGAVVAEGTVEATPEGMQALAAHVAV